MKRTKLLLVLLFVMILSSFTACGHLHAMGGWEIGTDPTWEEEGVYVQKCIGCDAFVSQAIPALKDTSVWTLTERVEPTHYASGKNVYESTYGVVESVIPAIEHVYSDVYTITKKPTLTKDGEAVHSCECGHPETVKIANLSNAEVWAVETDEATHFETGLATYTSIYGTVEVEIPVIAHTYGTEYTITVEPTIDTMGKATHVCSCNDVEEVGVPALSNAEVWAVETDEATHFAAGLSTYTSIYGTIEIEIPVIAHTYGNYAWKGEVATIDNGGVIARSCECENEETMDVPALSDSEFWSVEHTVLANYNAGGLDTYSCEYGVQAEVILPKLVAPYDGKTYGTINVDASGDDGWKNGVITADAVWSHATIVLDSNGQGIGTAYPFRGAYKFVMVNSLTGEIVVNSYEQLKKEVWVPDEESMDPEAGEFVEQGVVDENGNPVYNWNKVVSTYTAWVDFESGLIIAPRNTSLSDVNIYTPFGIPTANNVKASAWDNAIAIEFTAGEATYSIFVYDGRAYFGVSFEDLSGNAISANECYNQANIHVLDKNGALIAGFAFDVEEGKLVVADGKEGSYANGSDTLVLNGAGVATYNGVSATYTVNGDTIGVYANGEYYDVTLNGSEFNAVKTMVTITFDGGEYATVEAVTVNKNIAITLPTPTNETHTFKGWFYDEACTQPASDSFVPVENDTLYASWKAKVIVNLDGVLEGDDSVIYLGEGDVIGDFLPVYGVVESIGKFFEGWYLDSTFETTISEDMEIFEENSGVTIYAKWNDLPAYYGTYYGAEHYNYRIYSAGKTLNIDEKGNISGLKTGTVLSYDSATQVVQWTSNGTTIYRFYFNAELGVIAGMYNNENIGNDYYFLSRSMPVSGNANAVYGVKAAKSPSDSTRNYYAHFINANTDLGEREIFIYNNYIYTNFTAVDGNGNPLTAATVKDSKIVVVKDENGNIIISVASKGASFAVNNETVDLDAYFGSYACGDSTVVLDGNGGITYGNKTGTYTKVEGKDYGFDVYFGNNEEYWQLTLNGDSCTMVKPMVSITLVGGAYAEDQTVEVNVNVAYTLPTLTHETNVFNGWFYDEAFNQPVGDSFVPTEDDTFYALWKVKAVLTVVYNNGEENGEFTYSVGDVATVEMPIYAKHAFAGWYTSENFAEGTEWTSGTEIADHLTIYAKWEDAPIYNNKYMANELDDTTVNGGTESGYCRTSAILNIDPYGKDPSINSYPYNGGVVIENYNAETGALVINAGNGTYLYEGFIDAQSGIIVHFNYSSSNGKTEYNKVKVLSPFETANNTSRFSTSYWNSGYTRTIEYTYDGTTYRIFVDNNNVYFGVTFTDANGNAIAGNACYQASILYVKDANGNLIAKFAHDGTTLQEMDGYEGTYAVEGGEIVVDGVKTITIGGVTGEYSKAAEGSSYTHDAYVGNEYFEVTLDNVNYTAVVVKPMVTITFESDYTAVESITVNKNIEITLPTPTNDAYIFRAWYSDSAFTNLVNNAYVPTANTTLYAKWDAKVTLTVVYGNGLDNVEIGYAIGDTISLPVPGETDGLFFEGWYSDAACTTPFTATTISSNLTVYCNWTDVAPFTIEAYGSAMAYDATTGAWTSTNQGKNSSSSGMTITATTIDIEVSFNWSVSSENNWDGLVVNANGQQLITEKTGGSGEKSDTMTVTVRAGSNIQIYYKKDGSGNNGDDTLTITNLTVAGVVITDYKGPTGTYVGITTSCSSEAAAVRSGNEGKTIKIDNKGTISEWKKGTIKDYDAETGTFKYWNEKGTSWYFGQYYPEYKVVVIAQSTSGENAGTNYGIYFKNAQTATIKVDDVYQASQWAGNVRLLDITVDGVVRHIFMYNNKLYVDVTYTSSQESVTAANAWSASDLTVKDRNGNVIASFKNNGTSLSSPDGYEGTYTTADGEIIVDGYQTITIGGVNGTYRAAREGSTYTHDATVNGKDYQVNLNKGSMTATVVEIVYPVSVTTSGEPAFTFDSANNRFTSENTADNSSSVLTITAKEDVVITFEYFAGGANGDMMYIKIDGVVKVEDCDAGYGDEVAVTYTLTAGSVLTVEYVKDNDSYDDAWAYDEVRIINLTVNGIAINGFIE